MPKPCEGKATAHEMLRLSCLRSGRACRHGASRAAATNLSDQPSSRGPCKSFLASGPFSGSAGQRHRLTGRTSSLPNHEPMEVPSALLSWEGRPKETLCRTSGLSARSILIRRWSPSGHFWGLLDAGRCTSAHVGARSRTGQTCRTRRRFRFEAKRRREEGREKEGSRMSGASCIRQMAVPDLTGLPFRGADWATD